MSIRRFNGEGDQIVFDLGACDITGASTVAALIRPHAITDAGLGVITALRDAGTNWGYTLFEQFEQAVLYAVNEGAESEQFSGAPFFEENNVWILAGVSKAAGTVKPRWHVLIVDEVPNWVHDDGSGTFPDAPSVPEGQIYVGDDGFGNPYDGDLAALGRWDKRLTDEEFESLYDPIDGIEKAWEALEPKALHTFKQDSTAEAVTDLTGNGADQNSITGTTVVDEDPPIPYEELELLFDGDEIADFDQISGVGEVTEVPDPAGGGATVLALTTPDSDPEEDPPRIQALSPGFFDEGDEFWLRCKLLIPEDFPDRESGWVKLLSVYGPPFAGDAPWGISLDTEGRLFWQRNETYSFDVPWKASEAVKGQWVEVLLHSLHSAEGFVEMWIDGEQVTFDFAEHNPNEEAPTTKLEMETRDASNNGGLNHGKILNYHEASIFGGADSTVYFDWLRLGTTRAATGAAPTAVTGAATSITPTKATLNGTVNPNGLSTDYWFELWADDWQTSAWPTRDNIETTPDFESGLGGWLSGGTPLRREQTTEFAHDGSASMELETDAENEGAVSALQSVEASKDWTGSCYIRGPAGVKYRIAVEEFDAETNFIGRTFGEEAQADGSGWIRVSATRSFGATGAQVRVRIQCRDGGTNTWQLDSVLIEQTAEVKPYFPRTHELTSGQAVENEDGTYTIAVPEDHPATKQGDAGEGSEAVAVDEAITGLEPSTEYHARLYASNVEGEAFGEDVTFETLAAPKAIRRARPDLALDLEIETPEGFFRLASDAKRASQRPTGLEFSTQRGDGFGPGSATLARKVFKDHPDINLLDTWRMVSKAGDIVYEGRLHSGPRGNDPQQQITATLVGWATYLRSRKIAPLIIERRLSSWGEPSTQRKANRVESVRYGVNVKTGRSDSGESGPGVLMEFQRKGERTEAGEAWLYAGGEKIARLRFDLDELAGPGGNTDFNTRGLLSDDDVLTNFVQTSDLDNTDKENVSLESGEVEALYAALKSEREGSSADLTAVLAFLEPRVYGTHGLTPVGTSPEEGFRLTEIMEHILRSYYPKLEWAGNANSFQVTQATWHDSPAHGYDIFQQLNNLVLWELSVWEERKVHFYPADLTRYDWQIRTDDPNVTVDFQGDSIENFANGISVTYTDFWGVKRVLYPPDHDELRDDAETNPANLHNENLWTDTEMPWPGTEAEALQFGRAKLAEFNRPKRPGTYRVTGYIQDGAGGLHPGWRVRSSETLGIGDHPEDAPRLITQTKWDQYSLTLTVTVDAPPRRLDAIVARGELARQARNLG